MKRKLFVVMMLLSLSFAFLACKNTTDSTSSTTLQSTTESTSQPTTTLTTSETISLVEGLDDTEIIKNHYFHLLNGVQVLSSSGQDLTPYLQMSGSVNYGVEGIYEIEYTLDYQDIHYQKTRKITVTSGTYIPETNQRINLGSGTFTLGEGSYKTGTDTSILHPANPINISSSLYDHAIPSNGWWTSLLRQNYAGGNGIYTNPLRSSFSTSGVEVTNPFDGFVQFWYPEQNQTIAQFSLSLKDIYVKSTSLGTDYHTEVIDYSDSQVKVSLQKTNSLEDEMVVTYTQGSPYLFFEVSDSSSPYITIDPAGMNGYEFYNLDGDLITTPDITSDHIIVKIIQKHAGYLCSPPSNVLSPIYLDKYYLINTPDNTLFTLNTSNRIGLNLGVENYFSVVNLPSLDEAAFYHDYGYQYITSTSIDFEIDDIQSNVITNYLFNTQTLKPSTTNAPLLALMPHHYRNSAIQLTDKEYKSVRGLLKVVPARSFQTVLSFEGMNPGFTLPSDSTFSLEETSTYLTSLNQGIDLSDMDSFYQSEVPYWNSKALYPLSQGLIISDQVGDTINHQAFLDKLGALLKDWYTVDSASDEKYLYYNQKWGSVYYSDNEFNTATELSDHSFTHGYLIYASAIYQMYDPTFQAQYGEMVDLLLNDYMFYEKGDSKYQYLRSFDAWAGHSWAHGYGSFAEGNNLESTSEALNSWVGGYLWGLATNDSERVEAAIYGYATELASIKEYWYDYHQDVWSDLYRDHASVAGIVWGGKFDYATWFGANPTFIYGIQWLPTGEFLTSLALDDFEYQRLSAIYQDYLQAKNGVIDTWYSNMWAMESITSPLTALAKFDANKILNDDYPSELVGSYWMIHGMNSLGRRTTDIWMEINHQVTSSIYQDESGDYYAMVWNPQTENVTLTFRDHLDNTYVETVPGNSFTKIKIE